LSLKSGGATPPLWTKSPAWEKSWLFLVLLFLSRNKHPRFGPQPFFGSTRRDQSCLLFVAVSSYCWTPAIKFGLRPRAVFFLFGGLHVGCVILSPNRGPAIYSPPAGFFRSCIFNFFQAWCLVGNDGQIPPPVHLVPFPFFPGLISFPHQGLHFQVLSSFRFSACSGRFIKWFPGGAGAFSSL